MESGLTAGQSQDQSKRGGSNTVSDASSTIPGSDQTSSHNKHSSPMLPGQTPSNYTGTAGAKTVHGSINSEQNILANFAFHPSNPSLNYNIGQSSQAALEEFDNIIPSWPTHNLDDVGLPSMAFDWGMSETWWPNTNFDSSPSSEAWQDLFIEKGARAISTVPQSLSEAMTEYETTPESELASQPSFILPIDDSLGSWPLNGCISSPTITDLTGESLESGAKLYDDQTIPTLHQPPWDTSDQEKTSPAKSLVGVELIQGRQEGFIMPSIAEKHVPEKILDINKLKAEREGRRKTDMEINTKVLKRVTYTKNSSYDSTKPHSIAHKPYVIPAIRTSPLRESVVSAKSISDTREEPDPTELSNNERRKQYTELHSQVSRGRPPAPIYEARLCSARPSQSFNTARFANASDRREQFTLGAPIELCTTSTSARKESYQSLANFANIGKLPEDSSMKSAELAPTNNVWASAERRVNARSDVVGRQMTAGLPPLNSVPASYSKSQANPSSLGADYHDVPPAAASMSFSPNPFSASWDSIDHWQLDRFLASETVLPGEAPVFVPSNLGAHANTSKSTQIKSPTALQCGLDLSLEYDLRAPGHSELESDHSLHELEDNMPLQGRGMSSRLRRMGRALGSGTRATPPAVSASRDRSSEPQLIDRDEEKEERSLRHVSGAAVGVRKMSFAAASLGDTFSEPQQGTRTDDEKINPHPFGMAPRLGRSTKNIPATASGHTSSELKRDASINSSDRLAMGLGLSTKNIPAAAYGYTSVEPQQITSVMDRRSATFIFAGMDSGDEAVEIDQEEPAPHILGAPRSLGGMRRKTVDKDVDDLTMQFRDASFWR